MVSGELVVEVESVVAVDGTLDARSHHALLLATRNLLAWTSNRVPPAMSSDLRLLTGVYADLGVQLDRLDPETVTMPRIQALVFSYIFDSADVNAGELGLSACVMHMSGQPQFHYDTDLIDVSAERLYLGEDFNPGLGFVRRRDFSLCFRFLRSFIFVLWKKFRRT